MRETRQNKVPKYAVEQILDSRVQVFTNDALDTIESGNCIEKQGNRYRFKLDPTFAFSESSRKSIAVRDINVRHHMIGKKLMFHFSFKAIFVDTAKASVPADFYYTVILSRQNTLEEILFNVQESIQKQIKEKLSDDSVIFDLNIDTKLNRLNMVINFNTTTYKNVSCYLHNLAYPTDTKNIVSLCNAREYLNLGRNRKLDMRIVSEDLTKGMNHFCLLNVYSYDDIIFCASFVNHTDKNIIGHSTDDYTYLNLIYPHNSNSSEIFVWTLNQFGQPLELKAVNWTMRLSLVCDSDYSYVMDD